MKEAQETKRKYEILYDQPYESADSPRLYRIRALVDIPKMGIKAGDFGGWIEDESHLSQDGFCWVRDMAMVYGGAKIKGYASVGGNAIVNNHSIVMDHAIVGGNALVAGSTIKDSAVVLDHARVSYSIIMEYSEVRGNSVVENSELDNHVTAVGNCEINSSGLSGHILLSHNACVVEAHKGSSGAGIVGQGIIRDNAQVRYSTLEGDFEICGEADVVSSDLRGGFCVKDNAKIDHCSDFYGNGIIVGRNGSLYHDNYTIMGPVGPIKNIIFYRSGDYVICSADGMIFDGPYDLRLYLFTEKGLTSKELKKSLIGTAKFLEEG